MPRSASRWTVLAALCLAVFVVNLATTVVNIALPSLVVQLDASTNDLLWIVDAFNLAFAALVLAGGSLSDRFGRRRALLVGLAGFAVTSLAGAWSGSPDVLIGNASPSTPVISAPVPSSRRWPQASVLHLQEFGAKV